MRYEITINADNEAFDGDRSGPEAARILRILANRIDRAEFPARDPGDGIRLSDINGNYVGDCKLVDE
jgi:hypothetical protein